MSTGTSVSREAVETDLRRLAGNIRAIAGNNNSRTHTGWAQEAERIACEIASLPSIEHKGAPERCAERVDVQTVIDELRRGDINDSEALALANRLTAALTEQGAAGRGESGWLPIESAPKNEKVIFWVRPLEVGDDYYLNTSGHPIVGHGKPHIHVGRLGTWSSLSKATHWQPLPAPPASEGEGR